MRGTGVAAGILLCLGGLAVAAQQPGAADGGGHGPRLLHVVVTQGKNGTAVPELPQSAFTVLDNGVPQRIASFRAVAGGGAPVKVILAIDAVNVDFQRIAYEQQEIEKFLGANEGRLAEPTALAIVTDTGTQMEGGFSTDGNALRQTLEKQTIGLRELRRSAGFYGAEQRLDLSLKALDATLSRAASEPGRKFLIWLSPGWPLLSGPGVEYTGKDEQRIYNEVVAFSGAMEQANTTMYVVDPLGAGEGPGRTFLYEEFLKGLEKPSQAVLGDLGAQVMAVQSGGLFLSGNNDIAGLLARCVADASAFYEVTYQPPPAEKANEYHSIQVRVAEPHLVVRTRQGYYAQP